ncbi:putative oxidoreductase [Beauveria bassiana D1-5]|uniref:D-xylose 1-dehydrogenase (NADP(+), D-xylono-1,5-lactone-forming) n=1 Tax=Beauveria bassiana D1-5 TaxID=1245745 RepID=A0A0A2WBC6_BEABA|nr:putative oxidoreductase [Beauveria bassiana D1-5]
MLRWGILGTSFISDVVAKAILASDASHIQAVFGRDEQRLSAFADRYGIASRYTSLEALLADPAVDAVYVEPQACRGRHPRRESWQKSHSLGEVARHDHD